MRAELISLGMITVAVALFGWMARPAPVPPVTLASAAPKPAVARSSSSDPYRGFAEAARKGMKFKSQFPGTDGMILVLKGNTFEIWQWAPNFSGVLQTGTYEVRGNTVHLSTGLVLEMTNWDPYRLDMRGEVASKKSDADEVRRYMPLWQERVYEPPPASTP